MQLGICSPSIELEAFHHSEPRENFDDLDLLNELERNGDLVVRQLLHNCLENSAPEVSASKWTDSHFKRLLDIFLSIAVLLVFSIPMLILMFCIRLSSHGPAIFIQKRLGKGGRKFSIYKLRTMAAVTSSTNSGTGLTRDGDQRITPMGRWLRKLKLDEIPQFYNVLIGDMSVVGPRPKLARFAGIPAMPFRPGITGPATLVFRKEEELLKRVSPDQCLAYYQDVIKPLKAKIDICYMREATLWTDLKLVTATFLCCLRSPAANSGSSVARRVPIIQSKKISATDSLDTAIAGYDQLGSSQ